MKLIDHVKSLLLFVFPDIAEIVTEVKAPCAAA